MASFGINNDYTCTCNYRYYFLGKSTLAALLERFYDPQSGGVFIDDRSVLQVTSCPSKNEYNFVILMASIHVYGKFGFFCGLVKVSGTKYGWINSLTAKHIHVYTCKLLATFIWHSCKN